MGNWAAGIVSLGWVVFCGLGARHHWRVRRERTRAGIREKEPVIRNTDSMKGLLLEGAAMLIVLSWRRPAHSTPAWAAWLAIAAAVAAVGLFQAALRHLGKHWRVKAVVTADHELVTTGPYGFVRHPIFTSLFLLLLATGLVVTRPWALALAVMVYAAGTEIRIRAEDGLLRRRFGERFAAYEARVPAYLPGVR